MPLDSCRAARVDRQIGSRVDGLLTIQISGRYVCAATNSRAQHPRPSRMNAPPRAGERSPDRTGSGIGPARVVACKSSMVHVYGYRTLKPLVGAVRRPKASPGTREPALCLRLWSGALQTGRTLCPSCAFRLHSSVLRCHVTSFKFPSFFGGFRMRGCVTPCDGLLTPAQSQLCECTAGTIDAFDLRAARVQ